VVTGHAEITDVEASANWLRPSPKLRTMRRIEVGLVVAVVALVAGVFGDLQLGGAAAAGLVGGAAVLAVLAGGFVDRLIRRGVLIRRLSVVP
jgi:hypothetical protein